MRKILIIGFLIWSVCAAVAFANNRGTVETVAENHDVALWYARYAVHESANRADELPLWEVLKWRAFGPLFEDCLGDLMCSLHKYAGGRLQRPTNDRTRAILRLDRSGSFPGEAFVSLRGWNERYREQWLETVERADTWYGGEGEEVNCRYRPHHWGSRRLFVDRQRADRALREGRWRRAECEGTSNGYFCVVGLCEEVGGRR